MDLQAYRRSAETFLSDLTREEYRHFAGLKDTYEIEPLYERHAELFTRASVERLRSLYDTSSPGSDARRRLQMLLDFAVEGYIGQSGKATEAELAQREATLTLDLDDEQLGFRESSVIQANEPDAERRAVLERARLAVIAAELTDLHAELIGCQHAAARDFGYDSYRELCAGCKGIDLMGLADQVTDFTEASGAGYVDAVDGAAAPIARATDSSACSAPMSRGSCARPISMGSSPRIGSSNASSGRLTGSGSPCDPSPASVLDLEPRPNKTPRAFCAPVRVPDEVYLVLSPIGGHDDFAVLFHEGGHTEHYASVDPSLAFEYRMLGDNAITESFAFLLEHLVENPLWLAQYLGVADADAVAAHGRAARTLYLRRYCAKFSYELELHDQPPELPPLAARYSELLSDGAPDRLVRRELPGRRRSRFLLRPATCVPGRSRPTCAAISSIASARAGSPPRRPARCCGRCGPVVSGRRRTSCSASSPGSTSICACCSTTSRSCRRRQAKTCSAAVRRAPCRPPSAPTCDSRDVARTHPHARSSAGDSSFSRRRDLPGGQLVVAEDRKRRPEVDGAPRPVGAADDPLDGLRLARPAGGRPDLITTATKDLLDLRPDVVALLTAATDELGRERVRVGVSDAAARGSVVHRLLDPLAREHDEVKSFEDPVAELLDHIREPIAPTRRHRLFTGRA